jgi:preprotein translocase subunit SecF
MTTTAPPPPPAAPVEDIPGITRRHRFSDLYHERTNFQFVKHSKRWLILSTTLIVLSVALVAVRGLNFGIDFEGGTAWQVQMEGGKHADVADVRDLVRPLGFADAKITTLSGQGGQSVRVQAETVEDPIRSITKALADYGRVDEAAVEFQRAGDGGTFVFTTRRGVDPTEAAVERALRTTGLDNPTVTVNGNNVTVAVTKLPESPIQTVAAALAKYAGTETSAVSISTVGPTWGHEVSQKALKAVIVFLLVLAVYLSFRFEFKMAVSSIVAVLHDIIFTIGAYALFQFEVTPATVTAFLTILGFSLYDTVVVFDKVKENQRLLTATGRSSYGEMVNTSLNQVLMRSLSTSVVALLPVLSLLFVGSGIFGATALEEFALALAAGLFIGSYSSIFVAAPLLAWWKGREPQYRAIEDRRQRRTLAAASVATGVPVIAEDADEPREKAVYEGVAGPPAVGRTPPSRPRTPRPRQQRGRKRR